MAGNEFIDALLRFDALSQAEDFTGKSYKEDELTSSLGMALHIENGERKRALLAASGDTHWGSKFLDAVDIALDLGFELVYAQAIPDTKHYPEKKDLTHWQAFWRDGILLVLESYHGSLNNANIYFNWRTHTGETTWPDWDLGFSGGWDRHTPRGQGVSIDTDVPGDPWTLAVHTDVREGFRRKLERIEALDGYVLPEWYVRPFLHFVSYVERSDDSSDDYKTITQAKIDQFEPRVRDIIMAAKDR